VAHSRNNKTGGADGRGRGSRIDAKSEGDIYRPDRVRRVLYRDGDLRLSRPRCECRRYRWWYDNRSGSAAGNGPGNEGGTITSDHGARQSRALIGSRSTRDR
jgi:hypothetical protein